MGTKHETSDWGLGVQPAAVPGGVLGDGTRYSVGCHLSWGVAFLASVRTEFVSPCMGSLLDRRSLMRMLPGIHVAR